MRIIYLVVFCACGDEDVDEGVNDNERGDDNVDEWSRTRCTRPYDVQTELELELVI